MPFSPVKTSPWKKGLTRRVRRGLLWSEKQWARLVEAAREEVCHRWDHPNLRRYRVGPNCLDLIRSFNMEEQSF